MTQLGKTATKGKTMVFYSQSPSCMMNTWNTRYEKI